MLKSWYDSFPLNFYNPIKESYLEKISLKDTLSPLTKFTLNLLNNIIGKRNIIISIPSGILYPISIISYMAAKQTGKTVFVFTKSSSEKYESPFDLHYQNYYLLDENGYIFYKVPVAYMKDNDIIVKFYLPRADHRILRELQEKKEKYLKNIYLNPDRPKVLFFPEDRNSRIRYTFDKLIFNDESLDFNSKFNFKVIIFENIDRFIYSSPKLDVFLEWINIIEEKDVQFILHFSNPNSEFILPLKNELDALMLHYSHSFLKSHEYVNRKSTNYFLKMNLGLSSRLNIDKEIFYHEIKQMNIIKSVPQGNIDYHFNEGMHQISELNHNLIPEDLRYGFFKLKSLYFEIYNLFINPDKFKARYCIENEWTTREIDVFLKDFHVIVKSMGDSKIKEILSTILREFYCMYVELKDCKRFWEPHSYTRISKNYCLLDFLSKIENNDCIIVANQLEKRSLEVELKKIIENICVKTLGQIQSSWDTSSKVTSRSILILPGPILPKYMSIFFKPWKEILFFAYEGKNESQIEDQINLVKKLSIKDEGNTISYLEEIRNYLNLPKDIIFEDFERRKALLPAISIQNQEVRVENIESADQLTIVNIINELIKKDEKFKELKEQESTEDHLRREKEKIDNKIYEREFIEKDHYVVTLKNEKTGEIGKRRLHIDKTYMYMEKGEEKINIGFPRVFEEGYFLILIDQDERKSIIDMVLEISGIEDEIDNELIETWSRKLAQYFEHNFATYKDFYKIYKRFLEKLGKSPRSYDAFKSWVQGNRTYTRDPKDLYHLGQIMNEPFLLNYFTLIHEEGKKIQQYHIAISKKLSKLVNQILEKNIKLSDLSLEEFELYKKIENSIYIIQDIKKVKIFKENDEREDKK